MPLAQQICTEFDCTVAVPGTLPGNKCAVFLHPQSNVTLTQAITGGNSTAGTWTNLNNAYGAPASVHKCATVPTDPYSSTPPQSRYPHIAAVIWGGNGGFTSAY